MRLASRPIAAITVVLTIALGLPLATQAPAAAATTISFTPARPMAREYTWVRGKFPATVVRPVKVQYYNPNRGWTTYPLRYQGDGALGKTFRGGRFRLRPRAIAPYRQWRVVAPRVTINGTTYGAQVSSARRMYTVGQTASLRLVPAPVGQAKNATTQNLTPAPMKFTPVRKGRKVALQRYAGGSWRVVETGVQDARGLVTFNTNTGSARKYPHRALAYGYNGASFKASRSSRAAVLSRPFNDDFRRSALGTTDWGIRLPGKRQQQRLCSESSSHAVSMGKNGAGRYDYVRLHVKRIVDDPLLTHELGDPYDETADCPYGQYYNGHIGTFDEPAKAITRFDTTYGIMAARMKAPPGRGQHSAFWSQPSEPGSGAEIDIMEYFGTRNNIQHKVYWSTGSDGRVFDLSPLLGENKTYYNSFHVYSVEWTPTVYIFRVDGHETFRTIRGRSTVDQYMILSLLTSDHELPELKTNLPSTLFVDWVRVWR